MRRRKGGVLWLDIRPISIEDVRALCEKHHGYGSAGNAAVYAFGVFEGGKIVAAYAWQPPPPGAARGVCPEEPSAVLSLSRMVAVPKAERWLKHVSKPLMVQMKQLIDRSRWPVLVTYSDEGQGHTGYVYKCSGWVATERAKRPVFRDAKGARASTYANGKHEARELQRDGFTFVQRWEHRVTPPGTAAHYMKAHGWVRVAIPGKRWKSGNQAHTWEKVAP